MPQIYGYIRTSRQLQEGVPGMDPGAPAPAGRRAPRQHLPRRRRLRFHRTQQRQGWHRLNGRLAGGDTLVVVAIGRRWPDTIRSICDLRDRRVKIRSLAEAEAQWTRYLEANEGSPEAFFGQVLTMFAAMGGRPGDRVHQATDQGGAGTSPAAGQDPGPAQ